MKAEEITDKIIAELERGVVPWRKPWTVAGLAPTSLQTGKAYQGINALLLNITAQSEGYDQNLWVTFKQAQALGGTIKRGEKATPVIFWKKVTAATPETVEGEEGQGKARSFFMMKTFSVFNLAQAEGVAVPEGMRRPEAPQWEPSEALAAIWEGYQDRPSLTHAAQDSAFYEPGRDAITLPPREAFASLPDYAETFLHEITHSTGHKSRLDRFGEKDSPAFFGSEPYAREELVAEIGAAMLASHAGIELDHKNTAAYVGGWLKRLNDDRRLIITAAQRAAKATDLVLGKTKTEGEGN